MPESDLLFWFSGIIILIAAFKQGLTGFGFAMFAMPVLSLYYDIKFASGLIALCGLVINSYLFFRLKEHILLNQILKLLAGAFAGIPLGVYLLGSTNPYIMKIILGIVILLFSLFSLLGIIKPVKIHPNYDYLFGFLSGLLGGAFNTSGPPMLIYFYLQGNDKTYTKASLAAFFLITTIAVVISHIAGGITSIKVMNNFFAFLPFVLAGLITGHALFSRISQRFYEKIILIVLVLISLLLIIKA